MGRFSMNRPMRIYTPMRRAPWIRFRTILGALLEDSPEEPGMAYRPVDK